MNDLSYIKVDGAVKGAKKTLTGRCAFCRHIGTLIQLGEDLEVRKHYFAGLRCCPNPSCRALMSVRWSIYDDLEITPPPLIPFESQGIPDSVLRIFREAVVCHSVKCYTAAAITIRRTLEQICADRAATGVNLFKRIENLSLKIVLPQELREALHELRLLGNDAAHIEAETYTKINEEEILVAIEFTKEILKATYQYSELLTRMRGLKKDAKSNASAA